MDIYFEQDNNNADIYLSNFKNRKYLKKGIEYKIHFNLNHLIKLEYSINDTEVIIYNKDTKIILNNKDLTGILLGNNFKIKSNNNALIYFYPKTKKYQIKLNPKKGEIIEIKKMNGSSKVLYFSIDFGFEGYEPPDMELNYSSDILYMENLYDKLEIKLAKGEYLYLYYSYYRQDIFEINYIYNKMIISGFKYNFNLIKANASEKQLIIQNLSKKKTRIQINHCDKSSNKIKIYNKDLFNSIEQKSGETFYLDFNFKNNNKNNNFVSYEAEDDFILSYSYNDSKDDFILENNKWEKDRLKYNNLLINNIKIIIDSEINININFNVNYKNSLTKHIIVITPEENNNNLDNLKNFCFLVELINNNTNNFIIKEIYDIGENDFIEINITITKYISKYKKFIVNIISQELRYEKSLYFYEPKLLNLDNNPNLIRNILLILGIGLFLIIPLIFYYKNIIKKIRKAKKHKKIMYEEDFGLELKDNENYSKNDKE